jgi:spermidine/putrescine ABC transporter ATP-binding subunit
MSEVVFHQVAKRYGNTPALAALDLEIKEGEFLTLLGPSGCGKTTTLRLIAGFIEPTSGSIHIDGRNVTSLPPQSRSIGMVFQDYALFPHMTIAENIGFGLKERRVPKAQIRQRTAELLDLIRLPGIGERFPRQLSGGQQQRIALARAVAHMPNVLLMDEPLGALDLKLREAMQEELRRFHKELGVTTVYVTHDQSEAMNLSDRIAIMNNGRLVQLGNAEEIYKEPRTKFVASFIGKINLLDAHVLASSEQGCLIEHRGHRLVSKHRAQPGMSVNVGVRPEHVMLASDSLDNDRVNRLRGVVDSRTFSGNLLFHTVRLEGGALLTVESRPGQCEMVEGNAVDVVWAAENTLILSED